ncbi:MAG: sensor histidine kinase [Chloroflexi bacterium]|nr:MAG: sensor histidine kinase [Chloroflexota bacterium]MBL1194287.1 sensor histidine kinase [Chloroflexota bacterium]NOH11577.1 sensor histidine kinase [Chloroflexota bacterium]
MGANTVRQADAWEKWDWMWKAIFYTAVLVSAGLMLFYTDRAAPVWMIMSLTAILLLWHWGGLRLAYRDDPYGEGRHQVRLVIILIDILLWFILVNMSAAYYFVLFGLGGQIFRHLPVRYAVAATVLLTVALIYTQFLDSGEGFSFTDPRIWFFAFAGISSIVIGAWLSAIINQSIRRRELIEQLEVTQAELAVAERQQGVLEERQRLAREIHDTLAQGFTSIVMHLEAAEQATPDNLDTLKKHLDIARDTARDKLDEARRVVHDLRPDTLEQRSLPDAIERTAKRWTEETGISLTTTTTGKPVALHPDIEVTFLRATQEALHNIHKHAQATAAQLTLSYMENVAILDVQDNGVGVDEVEPSPHAGGYGLQAMSERAEQLGGSVSVESETGEGTTLVVSIPISIE